MNVCLGWVRMREPYVFNLYAKNYIELGNEAAQHNEIQHTWKFTDVMKLKVSDFMCLNMWMMFNYIYLPKYVYVFVNV